MFGFGWLEIALLLLVLIIALGPGRAAAMAGKLFGMARKVDETRRGLLDPSSLLRRVVTGTAEEEEKRNPNPKDSPLKK